MLFFSYCEVQPLESEFIDIYENEGVLQFFIFFQPFDYVIEFIFR